MVYVAALVVAVIIAVMNFVCISGVFALWSAPVFAARVPKVVVGSMIAKSVAFAMSAWIFLDPECPCGVVPLMFWADWVGSFWLVLKRIILLFRYEIQTKLSKRKTETNMNAVSERGFFVRYRRILRPRTQTLIMFVIFIMVGVGVMIIFGIWHDLALQPCLHDSWVDNHLLLAVICMGWIIVGPFLVTSVWTSIRLKKFPMDNWKMGTENIFLSIYTICVVSSFVVTLAAVPTFEGVLWSIFSGSSWVNCLQFLLPLIFHRNTVVQLATLDLKALTSLDRLLLKQDFLEAFEDFLRKEFSSENLYFWLEVYRLQQLYGSLLSSSSSGISTSDQTVPITEEEAGSDRAKLLEMAARDSLELGAWCVGDDAPVQLNLSGSTASALKLVLITVSGVRRDAIEELGVAVEEMLKTLMVVQHEVYELLRKDPYPRFLLTSAATKLNQNENFKRLLAAEKLAEAEVAQTPRGGGSHKIPSSTLELEASKLSSGKRSSQFGGFMGSNGTPHLESRDLSEERRSAFNFDLS